MPSAGAQAVNGQLRAEVAALCITVAAHGSTSECSSQTDVLHGDTESGAATHAKSERIAQLACAPRLSSHVLLSSTKAWLPPEQKLLAQHCSNEVWRSPTCSCLMAFDEPK